MSDKFIKDSALSYKGVEVDFAQELKDSLEDEIAELIQKFMRTTDLEVRQISLGMRANRHQQLRLEVHLQVCLPDHI